MSGHGSWKNHALSACRCVITLLEADSGLLICRITPKEPKSMREMRDFYPLTPPCPPIEPLEGLETRIRKTPAKHISTDIFKWYTKKSIKYQKLSGNSGESVRNRQWSKVRHVKNSREAKRRKVFMLKICSKSNRAVNLRSTKLVCIFVQSLRISRSWKPIFTTCNKHLYEGISQWYDKIRPFLSGSYCHLGGFFDCVGLPKQIWRDLFRHITVSWTHCYFSARLYKNNTFRS